MGTFNTSFIRGLQGDNVWWQNILPRDIPSFKRSDFLYFVDQLDSEKITVLIGPRRVGKTTLIQQIILHLLTVKKVPPKNILFASLDRPFFELSPKKLDEIISYYEEYILGHSISESKELIYLFIDEAHFDSFWARTLKQYADQKLPVHVIVSGSSAAAIYQDQESGAGRFHLQQMVTMKFRDAVRYRNVVDDFLIMNLSKELRQGLVQSIKTKSVSHYQDALMKINSLAGSQIDILKACLNEYLLKGGYPEFYSSTKTWDEVSRYYQTNVFDVILQKDVVTISNIRQPQKIRSLMVLIAQFTAKQLTREKIIQTLNISQTKTLDQYIDALSEAFLVRTSTRFKEGKGYPSTKPKKYYASDTGLRNAVMGVSDTDMTSEERGALLETAVFNHALRLMFAVDKQIRTSGDYWEEDREVDILLDLRNSIGSVIPLEVKNGHCGDNDIRDLQASVKKMKAPFGILVCDERMGLIENVIVLPAWIFMLSC